MENVKTNRSLEIGVSVIICTYNGSSKLPQTLLALAKQIVPNAIPWEIILIDNNSKDNSSAIAQTFWANLTDKPSISFTCISESTPGKYYALTRGLQVAKYSYFIIVDDDNWLQQNYIAKAFQLMQQHDDIGALGGQSIAVFQDTTSKELPTWFLKDQERYAIGTQGYDGDVTQRRHLWGAGMVSRTQLYLEIYSKYPSFLIGYGGKDILIAEDTEYCLRLILLGYKLYYSSTLLLNHFVPEERLTKSYWQKLTTNINHSFDVINAYYVAVKLSEKKYQNSVQQFRLKYLTYIRRLLTTNTLKKSRYSFILGFLAPHSKYHNKLVEKIQQFMSDTSLPLKK